MTTRRLKMISTRNVDSVTKYMKVVWLFEGICGTSNV